MVYHISSGAILYALMKSGRRQIYGVVGALPMLSRDNLHIFEQQMELELLTQGLGSMDFDGNFTVDPAFLTLIGACSDCKSVLSGAMRRNKLVRTVTAYLLGQQTAVLVQTDDGSYQLHSDADPAQVITEFLGLPQEPGCLCAQELDSGLILDRDREGLISQGCSEAVADLMLNACRGIDGYAQLSPIINERQTELVTLYYNENGILNAQVAYTWGQELFRLTPVTAQWVEDRIRRMPGSAANSSPAGPQQSSSAQWP